MGKTLSIVLQGVGMALALNAAAYDSVTLYFDVPNISGNDPLTSPPFPPTTFTPTAGWDTTSDPGNALGNGATPPAGLLIPQLQQALALRGIAFNVGYTMASATITLQTYQRTIYQIENLEVDQRTFSVTTSGRIVAYNIGSGSTAGTALLTVLNSATVPGGVTLAGFDGSDDFSGPSGTSSFTVASPSGSVIDTNPTQMAALTGNGFTNLPLKFTANAANITGGNADTAGSTFGYALVTVTYLYVPESSTVCAGAVLGLGALGFFVRRRMMDCV